MAGSFQSHLRAINDEPQHGFRLTLTAESQLLSMAIRSFLRLLEHSSWSSLLNFKVEIFPKFQCYKVLEFLPFCNSKWLDFLATAAEPELFLRRTMHTTTTVTRRRTTPATGMAGKYDSVKNVQNVMVNLHD